MKKFIGFISVLTLLLTMFGCGRQDDMRPVDKSENTKYIAFTFDDGPYTPVTNRILDVLEENNARATFFVVGNRAELYPESVKRAYTLGCEIGNHTYSHADLLGADKLTVEKELDRCSDVIEKITGENDKLFRPTGGKNNKTLQSEVGRALILWSVDTRDWSHHNCDKSVQIIKENVRDGSIILMHDLEVSTAECCEKLIPELVKQGYQLVTVSELLELNGIEPQQGQKYYSAY